MYEQRGKWIIEKRNDGTCSCCGYEGKITHIGIINLETLPTPGMSLCNRCLQWLKNKLQGF